MLNRSEAMATVGVKDMRRAAVFYTEVLGFEPVEVMGSNAAVYRSGRSQFMVYQSRFAGTNQATAVTWNVGKDVDAVVRTLKERGVAFEHYELPGTTLEGDVHVGFGRRLAWFKDPDGNILAVAGE